MPISPRSAMTLRPGSVHPAEARSMYVEALAWMMTKVALLAPNDCVGVTVKEPRTPCSESSNGLVRPVLL